MGNEGFFSQSSLSGDWSQDAKTAALLVLICRYAFEAAASPTWMQSFMIFLSPEILICTLGFLIAFFLGAWLGGSFSESQETLAEEDVQLYGEVVKVNQHRLRYRCIGKISGSIIVGIPVINSYFELDCIRTAPTAPAAPTVGQITAFAAWLASMAVVDEMHDTVSKVKLHAERLPRSVELFAKTLFLLPVFYLPLSSELYAQFALTFLASQIISRKIDTPVFKLAVAVFGLAFALRCQSEKVALDGILANWPVSGMAAVAIGQILYEIFGQKSAGYSENPLWQLVNFNTFIIVAVVAGLLPVQWLCCVSGAYPAAKIGFARGVLRKVKTHEQHGKKETLEAKSELLGKTLFPRAKDFDQPAVVPSSANNRVIELMQSGRIFRYTLSAEESDAAQAEKMVADWIGSKYCIGVNSCSSAIYLSLLCAGIKHGDKVLTNAFTFTAVPSSIHNVGAVPILVECTKGFQMDVQDLERKIKANPDAKVLLLSHFRGKLSDCDAIAELAHKYGLIMIEDCAHAMGVTYNGKPAGRKGQLAVYSVQSDKVVNAGEGGFITTDNATWAAQLVYLSGAYEKRYTGHIAAPVHDKALMEHAMTHNRNCSFRMSNVVGAMVCAQMAILADRVELWNTRGETLMKALAPSIDAGLIIVPPEVEGAVGCFDHCVFTTPNFDQEQRDSLEEKCKKLEVALKPFGTNFNARFFKNWGFLKTESRPEMEWTENIVRHSWDMKMPLCFSDSDWKHVGEIMNQAAKEVAAMRA
eukprot:TRINITY_DN34682_c0_g1_i1.p1 TRINITY_DN34682_c0_g1~~TRINITY_DN34682_c0_g1_i1.p1  ORF type:complete len:755 (+),score=138.76 TRINITY_DN34682_c0_g1_i1:128-2392(+)